MVSGRRREEGFSPSSSQPSLVSGTLDPVGVHGQLVCGGFVRRFAVENNQETEVCGTRPSGRKKRKWKWPASRTPPVEGRTSREEAQTMRNEPGQDIEPENPGVVCVVHAPSLARMCRDEDPALDKIWACFRPSALAEILPSLSENAGVGPTPLLHSQPSKKMQNFIFLAFHSTGGVERHISHPRHKPPDPAHLEHHFQRQNTHESAESTRLPFSTALVLSRTPNHLPKQKGKGGELSWCHSASQAASRGPAELQRGREHETITNGPASELRLRSHCRPSPPPPHRATFRGQQISMANGP